MKIYRKYSGNLPGLNFKATVLASAFFLLFSFISSTPAQAQEPPPTETPMDVSPLALPDLTFTYLDYSTAVYTNDDLHIFAEITNQSSDASGPFYIDIDIDGTTACFDPGDYYFDIYSGLGSMSIAYIDFAIPQQQCEQHLHRG